MHHEAIEWFGFRVIEIDDMCFKAEYASIQKVIKLHGDKGKSSVMNGIKNLSVKNKCFGEISYEGLVQQMKDKALPLLVFMVMKRNGDLKLSGCANGSYQRVYSDKHENSSPAPDFHAFKCICAVVGKEGKDAATVDLPGLFLQTECKGEERMLLKLIGESALLLVESEFGKWKKILEEIMANGFCVQNVIEPFMVH